ncbi:MAG TPA: hypothetical protein VGR35_21180 [Tepidisphaeraceae bacterium]|nr:hypothetical protein [Tepidisphaeraceae bacterium]
MGIENLNASDTDAGAAADDDNLKEALAGSDSDFIVSDDQSTKKPNPLIVAGLVLAVLVGGYLWFARSGPSSAAAAQAAQEDDASQTVSKFLDGGTANVQMMEKMLRETEKVVQQFLNYPSMKQVPLGDLQTNPFRFRPPQIEGQPTDESEALAKKKREEERQAVIKAVATLNLQSVIHSGARQACMINNTLYTEGQQIDSFVVEKINPGSVIVKSGVYRFELRMQK